MATQQSRHARLDTAVKLLFARVGLAVARRPYTTVLAALTLAALTALGAIRIVHSKESKQIWVPQNTDILRNDRYVDRTYGNAFRTEAAILSSNHNYDYATRAGLNKLLKLVEFVENVRSPAGHTYDALCTIASSTNDTHVSYCAMISILDLFIATAESSPVPHETYSQAARRALRPFNADAQIKKILSHAKTFTSWSGITLRRDQLLGGITGTGPNLTARALHHHFVLNGSRHPGHQTPVHYWEIELRKHFEQNIHLFHDVKLVTFHEIVSSLEKSIDGQATWVALGFAALTVYLLSTMGTSLRGSRIFIAIITLLNVVLALVSTVGLASIFRVPLTPTHAILPIILVGIGADDSFLIVKTFDALMREDKQFPQRPLDDRIAITMALAGSSILVTSATNSAVFFLGAISPVPALRSFNIWAGIGVLFDFLYSITFFLAFFKIDTLRYEAGVLDCAPCIKTSSAKKEPTHSYSANWALHHILSNSYSNLLVKRPIQACVILLYIFLLAISAWGAATLEVVFSANSFDKVGSVQANYHATFSRYFDMSLRPGLFSRDLNFSDTHVQKAYLETCNATSGTLASNPYVMENSVDCWLEKLLSSGAELQGDDFFPGVQHALSTAAGQRYRTDVICASKLGDKVDCLDVAAVKIMSTRTNMVVSSIGDVEDMNNMLQSLTNVAETSNAPGLFVNDSIFPFVELSGSVRRNSLILMLVSFLAISAMNFLLIGHPGGALLVLGSVFGTSLILIGMLQFWNVFLNPVSMIVLGMAIGLSIDGSTHMMRSFMEHSGPRTGRVRLALGDVGPAIFHGSASTLVAISFLAFSDSFVVRVIFKSLFVILMGSVLHSLVVLPVVLILMGPCGTNELESERRTTQMLMFEDTLDLTRLTDGTLSSSLSGTEAPNVPSAD